MFSPCFICRSKNDLLILFGEIVDYLHLTGLLQRHDHDMTLDSDAHRTITNMVSRFEHLLQRSVTTDERWIADRSQ